MGSDSSFLGVRLGSDWEAIRAFVGKDAGFGGEGFGLLCGLFRGEDSRIRGEGVVL